MEDNWLNRYSLIGMELKPYLSVSAFEISACAVRVYDICFIRIINSVRERMILSPFCSSA